MKYGSIALATFLSLTVGVGACATSSTNLISEEAGTLPDAGDAGDSGRADAREAAAPPKDSSVPPTGECPGETSQLSCLTCCTTAHSSGSTVYFGALIKCMCVPSNCEAECKTTMCASQLPDATCKACLSLKTGNCLADIKATCSPNPDCVGFADCSTKASCLSLP